MMMPILDPVAGGLPGEATRADELVLGELWISFVSLLRSHLGALQTTGKLAQAHFVALSEFEIEVVDLARTLHLNIHAASGEGEWSLKRMGEMIAAGGWVLRTDASASLDQREVGDMELLVEALVARLWARTPVALPGSEETAV